MPGASDVSARTKSADVSVRGTTGAARRATASGDVSLDRCGCLNVKSASGDVFAREVTGGVSVQTASGDVEIDIARDGRTSSSVSGDVAVGAA